MKKPLLIGLLLTLNCFGAAEKEELITPNTYNGIPINSNSLYELASRYRYEALLSPLPSDDPSKKLPDPLRRVIHTGRNQAISNYFIVKAGILLCRLRSAMHGNGADGRIYNNNQYFMEQMNALVSAPPIKTYQTASQAAIGLIANEALKKHNLQIKIPETYLYSTDNRSVDDNHAAIIQERIQGKTLEEKLKEGFEIKEHKLKQLFVLTESVGLWDLNHHISVDDKNQLSLTHFELPDNSRPQDFFYQDPIPYHSNIKCGITDGFFVIFKNHKEEKRALVEYVQSSDICNHEKFSPRHQKELMAFIKAQEDK